MTGRPALLFTDRKTGALFSRRWRLTVVEGEDAGVSVPMVESPSLIGAAPAAALVLTDDTVSRYHAEVDLFADAIRIRDLDSTNGSFIGDDRVREILVHPGGRVRIGQTLIEAVAEDQAVPMDAPTAPVDGRAQEALRTVVRASPQTRQLVDQLRHLAPTSSPVLLNGPAGAGKKTFAKLLHELSPRSGGPFVVVDLARHDETSAERALFGAMDGAKVEAGAIDRAHRGSLLLANVDRVPASLVERVHRVFERGEVSLPGVKKERRVSVRWLSTSSLRPGALLEVLPRSFGERLAVACLAVPALDERPEDLAAHVERLVGKHLGPSWTELGRLSQTIRGRPWPGNVRELGETIRDAALALREEGLVDGPVYELKAAILFDLLRAHRGHVGEAARFLEVPVPRLFKALSETRVDLDEL